jgi:hypothetical protein
LEAGKRYRAKLAQAEADALEHGLPYEAAAPAKRPGFKADEAALVYLITHAASGAAKVGIADMSGSRLAEHRREGWQILTAFQVTAKAAIAIETDVLSWWRGELGLAVLPQARPDASGRMDGDRSCGPRRPGGNGDADLQSGGS